MTSRRPHLQTDELLRAAKEDDGSAATGIETCMDTLNSDADGGNLGSDDKMVAASALSGNPEQVATLIKNLTVIAQAKLAGASPAEIVSPRDLRMAITTEMVGLGMFVGIISARNEINGIIADLKSQHEGGIEVSPLADAIEQITDVCLRANERLRRLERIAVKALASLEGEEPDDRSEVTALIRQAREVFEPFIQANHDITMRQLSELKAFLFNAGKELNNILFGDASKRRGLRGMLKDFERADQLGDNKKMNKIEQDLDSEDGVDRFRRLRRAIQNSLHIHGTVVAHAMKQNRAVLKGTPSAVLEEADTKGGPSVRKLFGQGDVGLVLPGKDDLKSK